MVAESSHLQGTSASPGIAAGRAVLFVRPELPETDAPSAGEEQEIARLNDAVIAAVAELVALKEKTRANLGDEFAHIFRSQQTIAEDESIIGEVVTVIREQTCCAETAVRTVFGNYRSLFEELADDDYNKGRAADIDDVHKRIVRNLMGIEETNLADLAPESIVVAEELYPSDTALMDAEKVIGLVTELGGPTSHVAILAKNLGIPAAVRVPDATERIKAGDHVVLDAADLNNAVIHVNPPETTLEQLEARRQTVEAKRARVEVFRGKDAVTRDGTEITLSVNVGSTAELQPARDAGGRSIGLYRSEFLFLNAPTVPSEEVQYEAYRRAAETFSDGFVIVRTLDVGGDKQVPGIPMAAEDNPFLGNRALRLSLSRPELFRTQLRAVLRAATVGNLKMMFPMVGGTPELDAALEIVRDVSSELTAAGVHHNPDLEIGIMVEIPSAVWVADALARRVSFFSIGTNDLTQYLTATDRLNGDVAEYYRTFDPAVFRAIREVAAAAERNGRWVGVCGELGGNPLAVPALVGMGVTELSMSPGALPEATWLVNTMSMQEAEELGQRVLSLDSHTAIQTVLEEHYENRERQAT